MYYLKISYMHICYMHIVLIHVIFKKKLAATTWLTLAKNAKSLINENTTYNCTFCNIV